MAVWDNGALYAELPLINWNRLMSNPTSRPLAEGRRVRGAYRRKDSAPSPPPPPPNRRPSASACFATHTSQHTSIMHHSPYIHNGAVDLQLDHILLVCDTAHREIYTPAPARLVHRQTGDMQSTAQRACSVFDETRSLFLRCVFKLGTVSSCNAVLCLGCDYPTIRPFNDWIIK